MVDVGWISIGRLNAVRLIHPVRPEPVEGHLDAGRVVRQGSPEFIEGFTTNG